MIESLEAQGLQLAKEKQEYLGRKLLIQKAINPKIAILLFWSYPCGQAKHLQVFTVDSYWMKVLSSQQLKFRFWRESKRENIKVWSGHLCGAWKEERALASVLQSRSFIWLDCTNVCCPWEVWMCWLQLPTRQTANAFVSLNHTGLVFLRLITAFHAWVFLS